MKHVITDDIDVNVNLNVDIPAEELIEIIDQI
jgi:hypothetical protein